MEGYDGSVTIKTQLDNKELLKQVNDVKRILDDLVNRVKSIGAVATQKLVPSGAATQGITQMTEAYQRQEQVVLQLQEDIERLSQTQEQTAEYKDLQAQIDKAEKKLVSYEDKIDKMAALYGRQGLEGRKAFQSVTYDMERLQEQYEKLLARQQEMQAAGTAFVPADTTALQERLIRAQEKQDAILARMIPKYEQLQTEVRKTGKEAVEAHKAAAKHTGINFNKIVKYTFGVRSLFALYRKLRQAAADALKTIAQGDPEFNAAMSRLMTSWNQIKADLGTLLQPIVQSVIPVLNMVLEKLHNALLKVAGVIAAILGQDYIDVVTVQTANYAGALDDVAKSASTAKKALGGYDKLNVISGGDTGGFSSMAAATKEMGDNLDDAGKNADKVERKAVSLGKIGKAIVGTIEEGYGVVYEYQQAVEEGGFLGGLKQFGKNLWYVLRNQEWIKIDDSNIFGKSLKGWYDGFMNVLDPAGAGGELYRKGKSLKEWFTDLVTVDRATSREFMYASQEEWENAQKIIKAQKDAEKVLRDAELAMWEASGGKAATKKALKNLKTYAKDAAKTIHDTYIANGGTDLTDKFRESAKNGLSEVTTIGRGMKRAFLNLFGFTDAEVDTMVGDVTSAMEDVAEYTSSSAKRLGEGARDSVVNGWNYTEAQKETIRDRTSALADFNAQEQNAASDLGKSLASAVSVAYASEAERVGKELGDTLSSKLRSSISFSEQDGKNAANELAKGMNAVSAQAKQNGSTLNTALQGVGKRIAEGINKGTISVPVTFTGQAAPVQAVQSNYPKVNTAVTINLDGKTISTVVFDEAERVIKQNGSGARAGVHYVLGVG